ncbi:UDP-glucose 4-epimerase GalE [Asticcacaulis sp. DW145]|uniref:UDP-glucose 4-epimerase GalE n=1 Tax=Asticcacaulis sp. DW145 TaxID=3095608 RepID=UPI00308DBE84|nr:UDP-glucose 4-epimerase GalE [Asticcacaulis sp. DW145]
MKTALITGGAGYIGSHTAKAFHAAGWQVVSFDSLVRGNEHLVKWGPLIRSDISDQDAVAEVVAAYRPDVCVHFAAFAYVGESMQDPAIYYLNNVSKTVSLFESLRINGLNRVIFSSTCATYGRPNYIPIDEVHPQMPVNTYGYTKLIGEEILSSYSRSYGFASTSLRYFNAAGADPDGQTGECHDPETHAVPLAIRAALRGTPFYIFGTDFDTPDGTAVRDYTHVSDLAQAHLLAAERLLGRDLPEANAFNLGTGIGTSVRELVEIVERETGRKIDVVEQGRRDGDPAILVASPLRAKAHLGWKPLYSTKDMIKTAMNWDLISQLKI